jgi:negative regulator of sigma E activity
MNDELFNRWIQRADAEVPTDFADRVMDAVRREPLRSSKGVLALLQSSPAVRVAACILACLACLYRMAAVVAVFFVQ